MAGKPGGGSSQDWALLLAQYDADYEPHKITMRAFFKERGILEKTGMAAFQRERTRTALSVFHDRNKTLLVAAQRLVMKSLVESETWLDQTRAAAFQLKVLEVISQREEPNPLLTLERTVELPPMFPNSGLAAKAIEMLTSGGKPIAEDK